MTRRSLRALAALGGLVVAAWAGLSGSADASSGVTTTQVRLRSFDGAVIAGTLFNTGERAPLVIAGHGAAKPRLQQLGDAKTTPEHVIQRLVDRGVHVFTYDRRGFGGSDGEGLLGLLEVDGADLQAVVDWVSAPGHVAHLKRDAGGDPAIGYSGYSLSGDPVALMTQPDLDALFLGIAYTEVIEAFVPGGKPFQGWFNALLMMSGRQEFSFIPELRRVARRGFRHRLIDGMGDAETFAAERDLRCADIAESDAPVMLMPGLSDGLYPLNQAETAWRCLREEHGREALLIGQDRGHIIPGRFPKRGRAFNALWPVDNPYSVEDLQPRIATQVRCPQVFDTASLIADWLAYALDPTRISERRAAEIEALPAVCLPLSEDEGAVFDELPPADEVFPFGEVELQVSNYDAFPDALRPKGGRPGIDSPVFVPLYTAVEPLVVAGIPHATLRFEELSSREQRLDKLAVFVGVGVQRPEGLQLLNEQRQPFLINRGPYVELDLRGVAARVQPGETVGLLVYGHDFFFDAGALLTKGGPDRASVTLSGEVWLPLVKGEAVTAAVTQRAQPAGGSPNRPRSAPTKAPSAVDESSPTGE